MSYLANDPHRNVFDQLCAILALRIKLSRNVLECKCGMFVYILITELSQHAKIDVGFPPSDGCRTSGH